MNIEFFLTFFYKFQKIGIDIQIYKKPSAKNTFLSSIIMFGKNIFPPLIAKYLVKRKLFSKDST